MLDLVSDRRMIKDIARDCVVKLYINEFLRIDREATYEVRE